jgi:RNA polymerase sigma-70 factor (ECF subfamily)
MTRRTTAHLFSSVNGVVESPNLFQFDAFGPEEGEMMGRAIAGVTDVVIGRPLWQEWSQYWPDANDPFGAFINPVRNHVVTSTLSGDLGWNSVTWDGTAL